MVNICQLKLITLNGQMQQGKWQLKPSQAAHLLAKVYFFSYSALAILHYACYKLTSVHRLNVPFTFAYFWEIHLREKWHIRLIMTTYLHSNVWKQTSEQSICSKYLEMLRKPQLSREREGTRGASGWIGFRQTAQNPVCWDFGGVKSPLAVQQGCHCQAVWRQNSIKSSLCSVPFHPQVITSLPLFVTDW